MAEDPLYQHPLAYLLGLEGLALLRAFKGEYDEAFTLARLREIRELLDRADELGPGVQVPHASLEEVYAGWARGYDSANNQMVRTEQPAVWAMLEELTVGRALDAACGTGRHAARLLELGHTVIGVDRSEEMLAVAREKLPQVEFRAGELGALPLERDSVDLVVCGLAMMHLADLTAVLAEFARVLAPAGSLIISDWRALSWNRSEPLVQVGPEGAGTYTTGWSRTTAEYLAAALTLGFELRQIRQLPVPEPFVDVDGVPPADQSAPSHTPGGIPNPWALHRFAPEAANAAFRDKPLVVVLHLQRRSG